MHRIQLKGPWQFRVDCEFQGKSASSQPDMHGAGSNPETSSTAGTVKMPAKWADFLQELPFQIELRRTFNSPTNLAQNDRVELVFYDGGDPADVFVNGICLGLVDPNAAESRFEISRILRLHNEIRVAVRPDRNCVRELPVWGLVALEISAIGAIE